MDRQSLTGSLPCEMHSPASHGQQCQTCCAAPCGPSQVLLLPEPSPAGDALVRQKMGLLNFSSAVGWDPTEMLPVYLAAACDPSDQVGGAGQRWRVRLLRTVWRRRCGHRHSPAAEQRVELPVKLPVELPGRLVRLAGNEFLCCFATLTLQVSRRGDELLKKRCGVDSQKPTGLALCAGWPCTLAFAALLFTGPACFERGLTAYTHAPFTWRIVL